MATFNEPQAPFNGVVYEAGGDYSRETVTIASGAGVVKAGTVLGVITSGGKYTPYDDGLSNGAQTAKAVSLYQVDATSADVQTVVIARSAAVDLNQLSWHASADATAKTAAITHLAAVNGPIIVRS